MEHGRTRGQPLVKTRLYVEGAGQTDLERTQCRQAFSAFFSAAGLAGRPPRVVPSGGRQQTYGAFVTAMGARRAGEVPLLLVDSEAPVSAGHTVWQHLQQRDGWEKPGGANDDQAFLMVQVMETWFVADRGLLRDEFGQDFIEKHLAAWPDLEGVPKKTMLDGLQKATAHCGAKAYAKGRRSFVLLGRLDPAKVEKACPHARRLLQHLRAG
ncbi:MAG: DUF4276 family protein [Verrucomicrobia bacterium]|nr:DUF4276 family protein [Verrucomicrobiota bacterium]